MAKDIETNLPKGIEMFLAQNKIAGVCFVNEQNAPYCITCFYCFDKKSVSLIFKSSKGTTHDNLIKPGKIVSGTILPDKIDFLKLKGIQFSAVLMAEEEIEMNKLKSLYTKKFLIGAAIPGYIWAARLTFIKFTDNSLGFGNKAVWKSL